MMRKCFWMGFVLVVLWLDTRPINSQTDSLLHKKVEEVMISGVMKNRVRRAAVPQQSISTQQINLLGAQTVADAARHFSGVSIKDYGGVGGLKTISVRSLGAQHTAISYDGISVSDCQTGQIDLGRFALQQVSELTLSNGQSDQIFVSARELSAAGVLQIRSAVPVFTPGRATRAAFNFKTGSWGLVNPWFSLEQKIDSGSALRLTGEYLNSNGQYPFALRYGGEGALVTQERRSNSEVQNVRVEGNYYRSGWAKWHVKAYYFQSDRGLPKATTYYNLESKEQLDDRQAFLQARMEKQLNLKWKIQTSAKLNYNYNRYQNPETPSGASIDNQYRQSELYLSGVVNYRAANALQLNLSVDGLWNGMDTNSDSFEKPLRQSVLSALSAKYVHERFSFTGSVLNQAVHDTGSGQSAPGSFAHWSPYAGISVRILDGEELYVRYFYKDVIRVPSFNDLYYEQVGNRNLKPETAVQHNIGATFGRLYHHGIFHSFHIAADGYFNRIKDKIVAIPTQNLFIWSVVNLGAVDITGFDLSGELALQLSQKNRIEAGATYTYQHAIDVTNPSSSVYGDQIAYTPKISGSGRLQWTNPVVNVGYSVVWSGKRYFLGDNVAANALDGYSDQSIQLEKSIQHAGMVYRIQAEVLNVAGHNYQVVRNFPMPGRSWRLTLSIQI